MVAAGLAAAVVGLAAPPVPLAGVVVVDVMLHLQVRRPGQLVRGMVIAIT